MKRCSSGLCFFTALCLLLPALLPAQVDTAWVRRYNGPGNAADRAYAIALDAQANVYVTGSATVTALDYDYATVKYNSAGVQQWVLRYDGPGNSFDQGRAMVVDSAGTVHVTGESNGTSTNYDYATIEYSSSGVQQWAARYDGPAHRSDLAHGIAAGGAGSVYVTGESESTGTSTDYATVKYDSLGIEQWARRYNGPGNSDDYGLAIAADNQGNVYVTGTSTGSGTGSDFATIKYSSAGETLWIKRYNGPTNDYDGARAIAVDGAGNVYVTGTSYNGTGTSNDMVTIKYSPSGVERWVREYDGPAHDYDATTAIAVDGSGHVYVTGYSVVSGTNYDYATIMYDSSGNQQWVAWYFGHPIQSDFARAIALDDGGNCYVTGESYSGGFDYATVKYDPAGESLWTKRYNGSLNSDDYATAVVVDDSGYVYVTGRSTGTGYDYATVKYVQTQSGMEGDRLSPSTDRIPLAVYPNPAKTAIRIRGSLPAGGMTAIRILDGSGKLVREIAMPASQTRNGAEAVASLEGMNPGIYFLRFGAETHKFLLVK